MQILVFLSLYFSCSNIPLPNYVILPSHTKGIFQGTFKERGEGGGEVCLNLNIQNKATAMHQAVTAVTVG